jgi:hypothetical protein
MTAQFALVEVDRIDRLEQRIDTLLRLVEQSHIQRAPEWVTVSEAAQPVCVGRAAPASVSGGLQAGRLAVSLTAHSHHWRAASRGIAAPLPS